LVALQLEIDALTAPKPERPQASGSGHHQSSGGGKNQPPNGVIQSEPLPPSPSSANRN
uniref:Transcriptional regulator n=1 Tax=Rodentolepis nana TaxID=102285 RepID=A0A0R3T571_RODNA